MEQESDPTKIFEIMEPMGEGSYGTVYKAKYAKNNRLVAIKIIPSIDYDSDIRKEIYILKECRSNHIIRYYGSYYKDGDLWIIMEFGDMGSLADLINKEPNIFSEQEIQHLLASVVLGLYYLHSNKKIHRDIKASNVLFTKDGKAKLADFGVSVRLENTLSKRKTVIGTPLWMAPEIIQETTYDAKADIWSLGITAIELAEGLPPLSNIQPMRAIFMIPNRPPPRLRAGSRWSNLFSDFIAHCLEKNSEKRASAQELLQHPFIRDAVMELEKNEGTSQVLQNLAERMSRRREDLLRKKRLSDESNHKGPADGAFLNNSCESEMNDTIVHIERKDRPRRMMPSNPRKEILSPPPVETQREMNIVSPLMQQARSRFFLNNAAPTVSSAPRIPITHMQLAGNVNRHLTEQQQVVMDMMPQLPLSSGYPMNSTEKMMLKRRGEELQMQFLNDFQLLYDTYFSEIQRISNELKALDK